MPNPLCETCGTPMEPAAVGGMCPRCMLNMARGAGNEATRAATGALATPPKPSDIERLFPELEILDIVGQGGMGFVYKARQRNLGRVVALKLLSDSLRDDPQFAERFSREARAMAMMNHPNIIAIYDFGHREEYYFLVMEFVDGLNLRQLSQTTQVSPAEAIQLVPQLCDALQYAHDRGIVHRDIKPENVLLSQDGQIKIADFGLAKLTGQGNVDLTLTNTQQVMGTLNYMAPEQRERPTEVDHRADIYSLGVVIYELLTGELPIGRFSPPSRKIEVDVRLDELVLRALEKEPAMRYQQASELKTGFQSLAGPHAAGLVAGTYGMAGARGRSWAAAKVVKFLLAIVALACCIGGVLLLVLSGMDDEMPISVGMPLKAVGFVVGAFGGFLFAVYGFYSHIFANSDGDTAPLVTSAAKAAEAAAAKPENKVRRTQAGRILNGFATAFWFSAISFFAFSSSWGGDFIPDSVGRFGSVVSVIIAIFLGTVAKQFDEEPN